MLPSVASLAAGLQLTVIAPLPPKLRPAELQFRFESPPLVRFHDCGVDDQHSAAPFAAPVQPQQRTQPLRRPQLDITPPPTALLQPPAAVGLPGQALDIAGSAGPQQSHAMEAQRGGQQRQRQAQSQRQAAAQGDSQRQGQAPQRPAPGQARGTLELKR